MVLPYLQQHVVNRRRGMLKNLSTTTGAPPTAAAAAAGVGALACLLLMMLAVSFLFGGSDESGAPPVLVLNTTRRSERFPSVEDRVRMYMGSWYDPPCTDGGHSRRRLQFRMVQEKTLRNRTRVGVLRLTNGTAVTLRNHVVNDHLFFLDQEKVIDCTNNKFEKDNNDDSTPVDPDDLSTLCGLEDVSFNMIMYCRDVIDSVFVAHRRARSTSDSGKPLLVQFGDRQYDLGLGFLPVPHFKKLRSVLVRSPQSSALTSVSASAAKASCEPRPLQTAHGWGIQPILWKLATYRHYALIPKVYASDTPWEDKLPKAVFRGALTGYQDRGTLTDYDFCMKLPRCQMVYQHATSEIIDARLTSTLRRIPNRVHGVNLVTRVLQLPELLKYKAIVMVEGNDVASGLKWALLSQSVVLMAPPKHTTWAMEELLEPWVHYVPLQPDLKDVEEQMRWVLDHDTQARAIAERGSLWIRDLCLHPDAARDDANIQHDMMRRYMAHFQ